MAQPFTELLADRFTFHAVDIARFEAHARTSTLQLLKNLEGKLVQDLERLNPTATVQKRRRLEALLKAVRTNIQDAYSGIKRDSRRQLVELADIVADTTAETINKAAKVPLLNVGLPAETLKALVDDTIIQGAPAREWWSRQAGNLYQRFSNEIREGVFRGETLTELMARIRGTREFDFRNGIMDVTRRDAESLIRTSVQSIHNAARYEVLAAHPDVVKGIQALATLDGRTSDICRGRSGFAWYLDGRPLTSETNIPFPGHPPWHFRCRTTLVPITYSWEELAGNRELGKKVQAQLKDLPKSTQASMDGQVAEDLTYEDWLKTKPESFQKEVLGPAKWELWQQGKLPLREMIDQSGRPLTIEQLRAKLKGDPSPPPAPPPPPPPPPPAPPPPAPPKPKRTRKKPAPTPKPAEPPGTAAPPWTPSTPGFEWHEAAMTTAPEYIKRAIGNLPPLRRLIRTIDDGHYNPGTRHINMKTTYRTSDPEHQDIWRHEYGHHIDNMLGNGRNISASRAWEAEWAKDAKNAMDTSFQAGRNAARDAADQRGRELVRQMKDIRIREGAAARDRWVRDVFSQAGLNYDEFKAMIEQAIRPGKLGSTPIADSLRLLAAWEHGAVTLDLQLMFGPRRTTQMGIQFMDIFGALTRNKIGYGHRTDYYDADPRRHGAEAFANVFAALSHPNPMWGKMVERFVPHLTRLVRGALENA